MNIQIKLYKELLLELKIIINKEWNLRKKEKLSQDLLLDQNQESNQW